MPSRRAKLFPTPDDAESAFYDAFERADLAAMLAVWAQSDKVVCVHPNGPRLLGFEAVRDSWIEILAGGARMRVKAGEVQRFDGQGVAVHSVVEVLSSTSQQGPTQSVCATNVYELTDGGWRMVIHHATALEQPAKPEREEPPAAPHTLH